MIPTQVCYLAFPLLCMSARQFLSEEHFCLPALSTSLFVGQCKSRKGRTKWWERHFSLHANDRYLLCRLYPVRMYEQSTLWHGEWIENEWCEDITRCDCMLFVHVMTSHSVLCSVKQTWKEKRNSCCHGNSQNNGQAWKAVTCCEGLPALSLSPCVPYLSQTCLMGDQIISGHG